MANICFGRLTLKPCEKHDLTPRFDDQTAFEALAAEFKEKCRCDDFEIVGANADFVDIECGFRWMPPFDDLAALSKKCHLSVRCTYNEPGMCFMGAWCADDGVVELDKYIDY